MVCPAAPRLLLAVTLLLGSVVAPASQPVQGQAGGGPGQQLDHQSGAGESILVSVYVQLEFSDKTWPLDLALPPASAASSPRNLTGLSITTDCNVNHTGHSHCACRPGYQWSARLCSSSISCPSHRHNHRPCDCRIFSHPVPSYCQLLPPVPGNLSLNSQLQMPGDVLNLTLLTTQNATNPKWFLRRTESSKCIALRSGAQVSLSSHQGQASLSVSHPSHRWAGEYIIYFEAQGFIWKLQQEVKVPLQKAEVARFPDELSIACAASPGFQLSCCFPSTNLVYTAAWSPREGSQVSLIHRTGSQCLLLDVQHCPEANTTYTCVLESQGLDPLRRSVAVTIIRDGDIACPEDFSAVAWNVTKAGHVAQVPCPVNKAGTVKRLCGPDGAWGPVQHNCTDVGILALYDEARLLQAGQGKPDRRVPQILERLQERAEVTSSPSDLLKLLSTVEVLADVVAEVRTALTPSALKDLLTITDKVLDTNVSSLWTLAQAQEPSMGSDFLLAVETLARSLCPKDQPFSFSSSNVLLQSELLEPPLAGDYQISFSTQPPLWVRIPRYALTPLVHNGTSVSVTGLVLQNLDHLLPSNSRQGLGDLQYGTPGLVLVISIMADGKAFTQAEVIMDFGQTHGALHCVFWDHSLFQHVGGWSDSGCQAQAADDGLATQCICQHLTAFSTLMSRHTVPENPVLELLTQVGLGASILALLVCLTVYRLVWRAVVRNKVAFFRHAALLNMAICLLAADTWYLVGSVFLPGTQDLLCLATAFLCHFFYLGTFFWMLAQALLLAHQLLFVFHQLSKHLILSLMVILGYLCPLGFAGVTLGLYLPRGQYLREGQCWLDGKGSAVYTFVGPVLAIVGVNGLVLAMTVLKLLRPSLSEGPSVEKRQALLGVLKALLILTPIFGITWGLGLATMLEEASAIPHYIFVILNSSQGVFILWFGCLIDKKVQEALRKRFCHTRHPSSNISLATNETCCSEQSRGGSQTASSVSPP
ncbi:adhesion G-protein coupled receptor F3 [Heterocephalus glaber]|uniref:Adhesion G-protein coupled receptor F3 n=1 Tax=Heterocephalus glaber TaxID=10181 RepID=A0AAX6QS74_HETGA|nr:adhesion G-protein coupled receptor F3 [Heterocephalus glaber]